MTTATTNTTREGWRVDAPDCAVCGWNTDSISVMGGGAPVIIGAKGAGRGRVIGTVCGGCAADIAAQVAARNAAADQCSHGIIRPVCAICC